LNGSLISILILDIYHTHSQLKDPYASAKMGHNSDKMYVTHSEHASGSHTASSTGKKQESGKSEAQRLPL